MILIENWLTGKQNFIVGRILYNQFGKDAALKALFEQGEKAPGAREALLQALQALINPDQPAATTAAAPEPVAPAPGKQPAPAADPILAALQLSWKGKYKQMQYLRLQLEQYGKDNTLEVKAKCHDLCKQILALEKEIIAIWQKIDQYKTTGKLEEVKESSPVEVPQDPAELAKKISSVQRYIRRHKANAANNPNNAKYPALIKKYELELQQLTTPKHSKNGSAKAEV